MLSQLIQQDSIRVTSLLRPSIINHAIFISIYILGRSHIISSKRPHSFRRSTPVNLFLHLHHHTDAAITRLIPAIASKTRLRNGFDGLIHDGCSGRRWRRRGRGRCRCRRRRWQDVVDGADGRSGGHIGWIDIPPKWQLCSSRNEGSPGCDWVPGEKFVR